MSQEKKVYLNAQQYGISLPSNLATAEGIKEAIVKKISEGPAADPYFKQLFEYLIDPKFKAHVDFIKTLIKKIVCGLENSAMHRYLTWLGNNYNYLSPNSEISTQQYVYETVDLYIRDQSQPLEQITTQEIDSKNTVSNILSDDPICMIMQSDKSYWLSANESSFTILNYKKNHEIYLKFDMKHIHPLNPNWKAVWDSSAKLGRLTIDIYYKKRIYKNVELMVTDDQQISPLPRSVRKLTIKALDAKLAEIVSHHIGWWYVQRFKIEPFSTMDMDRVREIIKRKDAEAFERLIYMAKQEHDEQWINTIFEFTGVPTDMGANVAHMEQNLEDFEYGNVLNLCLAEKFYKGAELLLKYYSHKIDTNRYDHNTGLTPLLTAINEEKWNLADSLLRIGANPNLTNNGAVRYKFKGHSALQQVISSAIYYASNEDICYQQQLDMIHLLIKHGADVNLKQEDAPSSVLPLAVIFYYYNEESITIEAKKKIADVIDLLIKGGAKVEYLEEKDQISLNKLLTLKASQNLTSVDIETVLDHKPVANTHNPISSALKINETEFNNKVTSKNVPLSTHRNNNASLSSVVLSNAQHKAIVDVEFNQASALFLGQNKSQSSHLSFNTWYHPEICHYLLQLVPNKAKLIRVIFHDTGENNTITFKKQLQELILLSNRFDRPALFIGKEPGAENHFIAGIVKNGQLLFINPLGATHHSDCYQTFAELIRDKTLTLLWFSMNTLQQQNYEEEGLVSCGAIVLELATHIVSMFTPDSFNTFWEQLITNQPKLHETSNLIYHEINIQSLLPESLKDAQTATTHINYEASLLTIHKSHYQLLQTLPIELAKGMLVNEFLQKCKDESPAQVLFNQLVFETKTIITIDELPEYRLLITELGRTFSIKARVENSEVKDITTSNTNMIRKTIILEKKILILLLH